MAESVSVFVCHSSLDKEFARTLADDLRARGIRVWIDESVLKVGDSLFETIQAGLRDSDFVMVVLSEKSIGRPWVKREMAAAFNLEIEDEKKRILPIIIEDCSIPVFLKDRLYADFRSSYDHGLVALLDALDIETTASSPASTMVHTGDVILDIQADDGSEVFYEKRVISTVLVDRLDDFVELFTSDGSITDVSVEPGTITDTWTESNVTYYRVLLPQPLRKGQQLMKTVRLTMKDAFLGNPEYWEGKQFTAAEKYSLQVRFPKKRPPRQWRVEERDAIKTMPSKWTAVRTAISGRQVLTLSVDRPVLYRTYILRWWW